MTPFYKLSCGIESVIYYIPGFVLVRYVINADIITNTIAEPLHYFVAYALLKLVVTHLHIESESLTTKYLRKAPTK